MRQWFLHRLSGMGPRAARVILPVLQAVVNSASEGGPETGIVECGFELRPGMEVEGRMVQDGTFTASVTGLSPDSDYAFRAFAGNGVSRVYSEYAEFRTAPLSQDFLQVSYVAADDGATRLLPDASSLAGGNPGAPVLCNCDSLDTAVFQSKVRQIQYLCCNCPLLRNTILQQGLAEVGDSSFVDCPTLKSLEVPDSVESIGNWSFSGCTGLEKVYFGNRLMRIGKGVLHMPETSLDLYRILLPDLASRIEGVDYSDFNFQAQ